jgi:hypothetical protein
MSRARKANENRKKNAPKRPENQPSKKARNKKQKPSQPQNKAPKKPPKVTDKKWFEGAFKWLLNGKMFQDFKLHGNTKWLPVQFILLTVLWSWSASKSVTGAFTEAASQSKELIGTTAVSTFQGLANALQTWTPEFMIVLQLRLHELIGELGGQVYKKGRWVAIATDGSRATAPRTLSNEKAFCAKNYGKGKTAKYRKKKSKGMRRKKNQKNKPQPQAPQIWITMMWHMALGVPWAWKLGPSDSSERQHVMELLKTAHFERNTLFVADAGFVGYDFWTAILTQGHQFLVRVGGNVRLLEKLGYQVKKSGDIVHCWPRAAMKAHLPPLELRLVKCFVGKKRMSLLTSVLDESALTNKEIAELYKQRWGIELEFRCLKQTFDRSKLRSHTPERALVEMEWSIFGMTLIELFTLREQMRKPFADPLQISFAQSLNAIRTSLGNLGKRRNDNTPLATRLQAAVVDSYERKAAKAARYKSTKKTKPSCGHPIITVATDEQRKSFESIEKQRAA